MTKTAAKRVEIVSIKMVKESSILYGTRRITSADTAAKLFLDYLEGVDREHFVVICLNTKNEPTNITTSHIGSLNSSIVHPREVFKTAVLSNAASIIVAHNHPSSDVSPSQEDIDVTKRLQEAGKILGIQLLDHLILGDGTFCSLKEKGYIN